MGVARGKRGGKGRATMRRTLLVVWIALLAVAGGSATARPAAASGLRAPASAKAVTVGAKAVVTNTGGDPIRVREGAGTQYDRVAWEREGDIVSVLAGLISGSGMRISFPSMIGLNPRFASWIPLAMALVSATSHG